MKYPLRHIAMTLWLAALLQGCGADVSVAASAAGGEATVFAQGITGTVTKSVGDFFCCPSHGKTFPIEVPVHIIRGTLPYGSGKSPPLLADLPVEISVRSASDGSFRAGMLPGTYTVFAEVDGALVHNCMQDVPPQPIYCATEVQAGTFARDDIDDSSGATY